jgi:hypothetical protein
MTYDYSVSDISSASITGLNQPAFTPNAPGVPAWSVEATLKGYIAAGVHPSKISAGVALYGHSWTVNQQDQVAEVSNLPSSPKSEDGTTAWWARAGLKARISGKCYGPFKNTYGALPGPGCEMCGSLMNSVIDSMLASDGNMTALLPSGDNVAFLPSTNTWISYNCTCISIFTSLLTFFFVVFMQLTVASRTLWMS